MKSEIDLINRRDAIDAVRSYYDEFFPQDSIEELIEKLPTAQPERLTDDDFETIRIHLNAYKEKLCNQQRWEEAEEYQRIIDRFMSFASAPSDIIHCRECIHAIKDELFGGLWCKGKVVTNYHYCGYAERKEGGAE